MKIVIVHGWSVTTTATYGDLPRRLAREEGVEIAQVFLGKYISFHDEVRMDDLARALEAAVARDLKLRPGERFAVITHSTGGPVVRTWWHQYYLREGRACPMSHLVMLAPANFGSALARLGKGWAGGLKAFFQGVDPGRGVLDWLELGSPESWDLNREWTRQGGFTEGEHPVFPFVLTGQRIDRKHYDHLNSYTGETGSDGVVRVAAANLNTRYLCLRQKEPPTGWKGGFVDVAVDPEEGRASEPVPFALVRGRSHSGEAMGIMRSVREDSKRHPTVTAILQCLKVRDTGGYRKLAGRFRSQNEKVMAAEWVERVRRIGPDAEYHHPPCAMVMLRLWDDRGYPVRDTRVLFTGEEHSEDLLPPGFFLDRQQNHRAPNTLTYYLNHHAMSQGTRLGFKLFPGRMEGFCHYLPAQLTASRELLEKVVRPHETTMVDIILRRVVREGAFGFTRDLRARSFKARKPGQIL